MGPGEHWFVSDGLSGLPQCSPLQLSSPASRFSRVMCLCYGSGLVLIAKDLWVGKQPMSSLTYLQFERQLVTPSQGTVAYTLWEILWNTGGPPVALTKTPNFLTSCPSFPT